MRPFDPARDMPLQWAVIRQGIRWNRKFKGEEAAWRAIAGASRTYGGDDNAKHRRLAECGYTVKPCSWHVDALVKLAPR